MMMQTPDDNLFKDLLSDYVTPLDDDGFTQSLMAQLDQDAVKTEKLRRGLIYGASFVGGAIAAMQFPAFIKMLSALTPTLPNAAALPSDLPISQWTFMTIVLLIFVLWAALDRTTSELF